MQNLCLPGNYTYINFTVYRGNKEFRIKEVVDGTTAEAWLEEYSKVSFTTWRVLKTYPNAGVRNVYRKDFRCQHFTDRRSSASASSKNTYCPAKLEIIIKRYVEKSKARTVDPLVKDYPCVIVMKGDHNHPLISADILKHRDMSSETKEKLTNLFRQGHNPSAARNLLIEGLMHEYGDDYYKVAGDGQYLPSLSVVDKLFKKVSAADNGNFNEQLQFEQLQNFLKEFSEGSGKAHGGEAEFCQTSDLTDDEEKRGVEVTERDYEVTEGDYEVTERDYEVTERGYEVTERDYEVTERDYEVFYSFIAGIENGLKCNPEVFNPAFKKMVSNIEKFTSTQSGLVSTMYTLGLPRISLKKKKRVGAKNVIRGCHKNKIGVQTTAIG